MWKNFRFLLLFIKLMLFFGIFYAKSCNQKEISINIIYAMMKCKDTHQWSWIQRRLCCFRGKILLILYAIHLHDSFLLKVMRIHWQFVPDLMYLWLWAAKNINLKSDWFIRFNMLLLINIDAACMTISNDFILIIELFICLSNLFTPWGSLNYELK